jgi:hypothetical protein
VTNNHAHILKGVVHGKTIQLEQDVGLPDGQAVAITLVPAAPKGEGLERSFGAWSESANDVDAFFEQVRRDRKHSRSADSQ